MGHALEKRRSDNYELVNFIELVLHVDNGLSSNSNAVQKVPQPFVRLDAVRLSSRTHMACKRQDSWSSEGARAQEHRLADQSGQRLHRAAHLELAAGVSQVQHHVELQRISDDLRVPPRWPAGSRTAPRAALRRTLLLRRSNRKSSHRARVTSWIAYLSLPMFTQDCDRNGTANTGNTFMLKLPSCCEGVRCLPSANMVRPST